MKSKFRWGRGGYRILLMTLLIVVLVIIIKTGLIEVSPEVKSKIRMFLNQLI